MTVKLFMVVTVRLGNQYDYHLNKLYFTDSVHVCILYLSCNVKKFKTTVKLYWKITQTSEKCEVLWNYWEDAIKVYSLNLA